LLTISLQLLERRQVPVASVNLVADEDYEEGEEDDIEEDNEGSEDNTNGTAGK
jgi:hypothetical protein